MIKYFKFKTGEVQRCTDNMCIAPDVSNQYYVQFLEDVSNDPSCVKDVLETLNRNDYDNALEAHFLSVAKAWDYISIDRLIGYATSSRPQWKADALAFIEWRDSCVDKSYQVLAKVLVGDMVQPSIAEFIALMPKPPDQPKV